MFCAMLSRWWSAHWSGWMCVAQNVRNCGKAKNQCQIAVNIVRECFIRIDDEQLRNLYLFSMEFQLNNLIQRLRGVFGWSRLPLVSPSMETDFWCEIDLECITENTIITFKNVQSCGFFKCQTSILYNQFNTNLNIFIIRYCFVVTKNFVLDYNQCECGLFYCFYSKTQVWRWLLSTAYQTSEISYFSKTSNELIIFAPRATFVIRG